MNPPEGFNLRRDVYIRVASLLKTLLKAEEEWALVLPPWGRLYHWQSPDIRQVRIPWADFFDLPSLGRNIPVLEYEQFIAGEADGFSKVTVTYVVTDGTRVAVGARAAVFLTGRTPSLECCPGSYTPTEKWPQKLILVCVQAGPKMTHLLSWGCRMEGHWSLPCAHWKGIHVPRMGRAGMWGMQALRIMVSGSAGTGSCWAWSMRYGAEGGVENPDGVPE